MNTRDVHGRSGRCRFDRKSGEFRAVAREYWLALSACERLWRRSQRVDVRKSPTKLARAQGDLTRAEARLDAARSALHDLARRAARSPDRTLVKGLLARAGLVRVVDASRSVVA